MLNCELLTFYVAICAPLGWTSAEERQYRLGSMHNKILVHTRLKVVIKIYYIYSCGSGGDGLAVNMSRQHVCVLRVRVPPCGYGMAYGVGRQRFDPGLQVFLCQQRGRIPVVAQTRSCFQGWMHVRSPLCPQMGVKNSKLFSLDTTVSMKKP
jgi:hypothetical protein